MLKRWPGGLVEFYGMTEGGGSCVLEAQLHPGSHIEGDRRRVEGRDRAEQARRRHHLVTDLQGRVQSRDLALALALAEEHEADERDEGEEQDDAAQAARAIVHRC